MVLFVLVLFCVGAVFAVGTVCAGAVGAVAVVPMFFGGVYTHQTHV